MKMRLFIQSLKRRSTKREWRKRLTLPVLALGVLVACASAGFVAGAFNNTPSVKPSAAVVSPSDPLPSATGSQANPKAEGIQAETIAIRPWGFEPEEINRPKGKFVLRVDNRSGLDEVSLQLDREVGNRLRAVAVPRSRLDWREMVDLPPGTYLLKEANHPTWVCRITITPQ